jgi:preprotein translocase subunit YajC
MLPILQAAPAGSAGQFIGGLLPLVLIFVVFWFLLIRPQQKRFKEHQAKLAAIVKGDKIVTNGGLMGKVTKVADTELTVDFSGTKMQVARSMISDVRGKGEPANDRK